MSFFVIISIGLLLHILRLSIVLIRSKQEQTFVRLGYLMLSVGVLQTLVGASIPISEFSVWSRSLHLGLATIVWMVSVSIIMVVNTKKT